MSNESIVHIKNIKGLMIERYKFLNDLSPPIINDIAQKREKYCCLRNPRSLVLTRICTTTYGMDTISVKFRNPNFARSF